jgi:hypothetical protein
MEVRVLEELEVFTPLGLRFWDGVLDRAIVDGLDVRAWPAEQPAKARVAARTRSSVYTFRSLPGMRQIEYKCPDPAFFDASPPGRRCFVLAVTDLLGRFLPVAFAVALPLPYRGVFLAQTQSSPGVHLFSAPTRRTGERLIAVRGTLHDADRDAPAAWAMVQVDAPHGRVFHGLADSEGRVAVVFPYPSLAEGFGGSPASFGNGTTIGEHGWDITVRVFYEPDRLTRVPGTAIPEYRSILDQRQGGLWSLPPSASDLPQPERGLRLSFGQPFVLRTGEAPVQLVSAAPASP